MYVQHKILSVKLAQASVWPLEMSLSCFFCMCLSAVTRSSCSGEMGSNHKGKQERSSSPPPSHATVLQLPGEAAVDPSWLLQAKVEKMCLLRVPVYMMKRSRLARNSTWTWLAFASQSKSVHSENTKLLCEVCAWMFSRAFAAAESWKHWRMFVALRI